VIAQRREAAAREPAGVQITFGMAAVDGPATPPQAARRLGGVIRLVVGGERAQAFGGDQGLIGSN